jgi:hypothetical protein
VLKMNIETKRYILHESNKHIEETVLNIKAGETLTQIDIFDAIYNDIKIDIDKLYNIIINYEWIIEPKKSIKFYKDLHEFYSGVNVLQVTEHVSSVAGYLTNTVLDK